MCNFFKYPVYKWVINVGFDIFLYMHVHYLPNISQLPKWFREKFSANEWVCIPLLDQAPPRLHDTLKLQMSKIRSYFYKMFVKICSCVQNLILEKCFGVRLEDK